MKSKLALTLFGCMALAGCVSLQPANYQPRYTTYTALKAEGRCTVAVTAHRAANPKLNELSIRGSSFRSPTGDGFSGYIAAALNEELGKATLYSATPQRTVAVTMDKNQLETPAGTGSADISIIATITDAKTQGEVARVPVQVHREWPSSFVGASAMNSAVAQYGEAVAELNGKLFADQRFLQAVDCSK
jgi:hypothetical protein